MCYLKAQGELLLIKKDNRQEGTIWHHSGAMLNDVATFPLKEGVPGYGAIAKYSSANLNDDPLYLSPRGVYARPTYYNNMQVRQFILPKPPRQSEAVQGAQTGGRCSRLLARLVCTCDRRLRVCGRRQSGQKRQRL